MVGEPVLGAGGQAAHRAPAPRPGGVCRDGGGAGPGCPPWAAILFGITASSVLVQAAFVVVSESATPVLPPGPPQAIVFRRLGWREVVKLPMSCVLLAAR